ncbi:MAG: riboflavin kinase [Vezdaea aestivalis]|nr:MAG: riboflavin kinase [Vezdaea aestivalis]
MRPTDPRDPIVGNDSGPVAPFPLQVSGPVVKGFGRGSKELGIPTANIPISGLAVGGNEHVESGVYFGWAGLEEGKADKFTVYPMVMSIGWNPFYKNTVRSVEVHIMHKFEADFYDSWLNLCILGFIRPEYDYTSKESLIEDINTDIDVAQKSLSRENWTKWKENSSLVARKATLKN